MDHIAQVAALTTKSALKLAAEFWPGPTSVIVPADDTYEYAHKGEMSLAVRIPADETLRALAYSNRPTGEQQRQPTSPRARYHRGRG